MTPVEEGEEPGHNWVYGAGKYFEDERVADERVGITHLGEEKLLVSASRGPDEDPVGRTGDDDMPCLPQVDSLPLLHIHAEGLVYGSLDLALIAGYGGGQAAGQVLVNGADRKLVIHAKHLILGEEQVVVSFLGRHDTVGQLEKPLCLGSWEHYFLRQARRRGHDEGSVVFAILCSYFHQL